ncbi:MAG: ATPase with chaperone, ATP-binding subunit, partial [Microbacterium sp.]|nr:ATPase with chaperone, ATP-binding subunit [Microbacterium sp.]
VIVMTSNLGAEILASRSGAIGFTTSAFAAEDVRERVLGKLREAMRPEFLNRIDDIVLFQKLEKKQLREIVRLLLGASARRLASREVVLEVTEAAVDRLADVGYEPEYGARPLRRLIQREVDDRIADLPSGSGGLSRVRGISAGRYGVVGGRWPRSGVGGRGRGWAAEVGGGRPSGRGRRGPCRRAEFGGDTPVGAVSGRRVGRDLRRRVRGRP